MRYIHKPTEIIQAKQVNEKSFRFYRTPDGSTPPSITTVLGKTTPEEKRGRLEKWKKDEGEAAYHITELAKIYGTKTHQAIEKTLDNKIPHITSKMVQFHYDNLSKYLKKINNIAGIELILYSKLLNLAGTADCVAEYNGILSIIDYKTKRSPQREEWLEDPFIQATAYSVMFEELTGTKVPQIVILVSDEKGGSAEYVKNPENYEEKLLTRIRLYNEISQF